jgi:hypothetical protein
MEIHIIHEKITKYLEKIVINILPSQHDLGNFNKDDRETIQSANQSINSNESTEIFEMSNEDIISSSESADDSDVPADMSDANDEDDLDGIVPLLKSTTLLENSAHVVEDDIIQQLGKLFRINWSFSKYCTKYNQLMLYAPVNFFLNNLHTS